MSRQLRSQSKKPDASIRVLRELVKLDAEFVHISDQLSKAEEEVERRERRIAVLSKAIVALEEL